MRVYCGGPRVCAGELVPAEVLEVSPMVLEEAFEAVVEMDGRCELGVEGEGDPAWRVE